METSAIGQSAPMQDLYGTKPPNTPCLLTFSRRNQKYACQYCKPHYNLPITVASVWQEQQMPLPIAFAFKEDKGAFCMGQERRCLNTQSYGLVILGILICTGIGAALVAVPGHNEIIKLSSTTSQEPNQHSTPPANTTATQGNPTPATLQPVNPSVSAVTQAAVKMGVLSCVSRINQVVTFLTANTQSGVFIFPVQQQPDQHIFSTSFELLTSDDSTIYATASFFPNQDAVYDTVEYVNKGSDELEKTVFKNLKRVGVLKKDIVLLDGGAVKVFLMPAGSGTVVIKKEVVQ